MGATHFPIKAYWLENALHPFFSKLGYQSRMRATQGIIFEATHYFPFILDMTCPQLELTVCLIANEADREFRWGRRAMSKTQDTT